MNESLSRDAHAYVLMMEGTVNEKKTEMKLNITEREEQIDETKVKKKKSL